MKYQEKLESFGRHLKQLREEKNLSQQALADIADIGKKTVQRIEQGKNAPTLTMLFAISDALEVSVSDMLRFD